MADSVPEPIPPPPGSPTPDGEFEKFRLQFQLAAAKVDYAVFPSVTLTDDLYDGTILSMECATIDL